MGTHYLLLLFSTLFLFDLVSLSGHVVARPSGEMGVYQPIKDINNPRIQKLGRFAVSEHNKHAGRNLLFVRVVSGEEQVVEGVNFKLVIEAKDGCVPNAYEAVVYETSTKGNVRKLMAFESKGRMPTLAVLGLNQSIKNINDPHVQQIGRFAVFEHNKKTGQRLVFVRVLSVKEHRIREDISYVLVIVAKHGMVKHEYKAVVHSGKSGRKLTSFKLIS